MAKLHFKYGAMNSGKSDTLIKTAYNYTERGLSVATVKPSIDTKAASIIARGGAERSVDIIATPETELRQAIGLFMAEKALRELNCVLVDESQFLSRDQVNQLFETAKIDDISVIAYGLRADFRSDVFPGSRRLFELADNIEKIPTMCGCGSQAEFNCRKQGSKYVFEGEQVAIDGEEATTYDSLCGSCYIKEKGSI
ncbi:thymidine kinase [Candidatus Saccharibacteria bacterium]|nr:thymidine kinase [Candidatus Saccharibacteria bacterium]